MSGGCLNLTDFLIHNITHVRSTERCALCSDLLMTRPFYIFSCEHMFHQDCLADAVRPHLSRPQQRRLEEVETRLRNLATSDTRNVPGMVDNRLDQVGIQFYKLLMIQIIVSIIHSRRRLSWTI